MEKRIAITADTNQVMLQNHNISSAEKKLIWETANLKKTQISEIAKLQMGTIQSNADAEIKALKQVKDSSGG